MCHRNSKICQVSVNPNFEFYNIVVFEVNRINSILHGWRTHDTHAKSGSLIIKIVTNYKQLCILKILIILCKIDYVTIFIIFYLMYTNIEHMKNCYILDCKIWL